MNVLNAAFARAQLQARADVAQAQARTQAQAQAQARYRTLPMLGQYAPPTEVKAEKERVYEHDASEEDKENASVEQGPNARRRPSATGYTAEDAQVLSGLGFGKANGSGVLRKDIGNITVPPEAVMRTKKDRKSKRKYSP
jgi:hypothetical protein